MPEFETLGENLRALEDAGLLRRVAEPVDKDTELMPLVRCQFRGLPEAERTAWLFEHPTDARGRSFDVPVAVAALGPSRAVYRFNNGCDTDAETVAVWERALAEPIEPVTVADAPVQSTVLTGGDLRGPGNGADRFPVPISTPGFDPAPFHSAACVVTRDPETGVYNMGTYRAQVKAPDRFGIYIGPTHGGHRHWRAATERGERLEAALVIGTPPHVTMASVSQVPERESEFAVSGGLAGEPLELVDCETIDLQVPACAELVFEGRLTTETYPEGPFGEYTGYLGAQTESPNFEVTAVTHRPDPIYQAFMSQMPPSESSLIRKISYEQSYLDHLRETAISGVEDVALHQASGSRNLVVVQLEKANDAEPWQAMHAVLGYRQGGKFVIAVDADVDPHDLASVAWAMSFRVQPAEDVTVVEHRISLLDPVSVPFDGDADGRFPGRRGDSALLIDATRPWDYPPTSLPRREFMAAAIERWDELGLPELDLVEPWFGESFGHWTDEQAAAAEAAVEGAYLDFEYDRVMREE